MEPLEEGRLLLALGAICFVISAPDGVIFHDLLAGSLSRALGKYNANSV